MQEEEDYVMVSRESVLNLAWDRVGYVGDQGRQNQDGDLLSHKKLIPRETLAGEAWGVFNFEVASLRRPSIVVESRL